jgi:hypothetical protein
VVPRRPMLRENLESSGFIEFNSVPQMLIIFSHNTSQLLLNPCHLSINIIGIQVWEFKIFIFEISFDYFVFIFIFFNVVRVHCGIYKTSDNISYWNLPPPSFSFMQIVSTGLIFPFTHMCMQYLHYIHLLHLFPTSSPLRLIPTAPGRICCTFLFSDFVKGKKVKFCLK